MEPTLKEKIQKQIKEGISDGIKTAIEDLKKKNQNPPADPPADPPTDPEPPSEEDIRKMVKEEIEAVNIPNLVKEGIGEIKEESIKDLKTIAQNAMPQDNGYKGELTDIEDDLWLLFN